MTEAYPPNHFQTVIEEMGLGGASGAVDPNGVSQLLEIAEGRQREAEELIEKTVEGLNQKVQVAEGNAKKSRDKLFIERVRNDEELLKLRVDLDTQNK